MVKKISLVIFFLLFSFSAYAVVELDGDSNGGIDIDKGGTNAITASAARTALGLAIGSDIQAYNAILTTVATGGSNNSIFGINGSGTAGFYQNIRINDAAAQFSDATDATKLLLLEIGGITTGTTRTTTVGDYNHAWPAAAYVTSSGQVTPDGITYFPISIGVAASDETTDLTTGTAKVTFRSPYAFTLTEVRANVNTAPVGSTLNIDINESGTTVLSTVITIDASEKTSESAATPPVISDSSIADDAEITIDIDQIGSSTAGKGLKIWLTGTRTL